MSADLQRSRETLRAVLETHSIRTGKFVLASGATSNVYVDVRKTALRADGARAIGALLHNLISSFENVDGIGGMTLGADPILTAITTFAADDFGAIIVRKEAKGHGTGNALEVAGGLNVGAQIVAVDDVVTTAGSTIRAIEQLRQGGFNVSRAVCVVDRESGGAAALEEIGVTLHSLFKISEFL